jgi:hypothetical protein
MIYNSESNDYSMRTKVFEQDTPNFFDRLRLPLTGMIPTHHQLGNGFIDMCTLVADHAIIALFFGVIALDCDNRMG